MTSKQWALERLRARPIAHRGLHGCGRSRIVENSIEAAEAAIAEGFGIECDVQLSSDGEAIVFHDATLDRLTTSAGPLARCSASDLSAVAFRNGEGRIPTLPAFLKAIEGRVPLVIEMKVQERAIALADRVLATLSDYRGPVAIESFDAKIVRACLERDSPHPIGLVGPPEDGEKLDQELAARCDFLSWNIDHLADIFGRCPDASLTTWTVRCGEQQRDAARWNAQIVFEGFTPLTAL